MQLRMCSRDTLALVDGMLPLQLAYHIRSNTTTWMIAYHTGEEGVERAARWTLRCMVYEGENQKSAKIKFFAFACCYLGLDFARSVHQRMGPAMEDLDGMKVDILGEIVKQESNLDVAEWFAQEYKITRELLHVNDYLPVRNAMIEGNTATLKWLVKQFELGAECVRHRNLDALSYAAQNGHMDTLLWTIGQLQLTRDDIAFNEWQLLRNACVLGRLDVVTFVVDNYHLTKREIGLHDNYAVRVAAMAGCLPIVQFLTERYHLTWDDITGTEPTFWAMLAKNPYDESLQGFMNDQHIQLVSWMKGMFGK